MQDAYNVRRLASGDAAIAQELNGLFREVLGGTPIYQGRPPGLDYLNSVLAKKEVIVLVASWQGEAVGGLVAYEFLKLESARREIYIYDLAVREAYRRQGIATLLVGELRRVARTRGVWAIFVQADYVDDPAVAFYRKLGTQEEVLRFAIPL